MKIFKYMMAIAALLTATACNGKKTAPDTQEASSEQTAQQIDTKKKALVVITGGQIPCDQTPCDPV